MMPNKVDKVVQHQMTSFLVDISFETFVASSLWESFKLMETLLQTEVLVSKTNYKGQQKQKNPLVIFKCCLSITPDGDI